MVNVTDAKDVAARARDLQWIVEQITPEEFYWQQSHYDNDSRRGRELLFLIANHDWVRATSEIIEIQRSDSIETTIKIDVDLDQITHEAFRKRTGRLWMPIALLPPHPEASVQWAPGRQRLEPDPFATVADSAGNLLPMLPTADVRHQMSAAMAEIIVNMAVSHWPSAEDIKQTEDAISPTVASPRQAEDDSRPTASRDQCLLLSAAIYRLLRRDSASRLPQKQDAAKAEAERSASTRRIEISRQQLLNALKRYNRLLEAAADQTSRKGTGYHGPMTPIFAPELARRAVMVLKALAESVVIVVPINRATAPTVLTVRVPTRTLNSPREWRFLRRSTWMLRPLGRLEIDALMPTADADREVQIHLPNGMAFDASSSQSANDEECPRMNIKVMRPQPLEDLTALINQVLDQSQSELPTDWQDCLADLAKSKMTAAEETLQLYNVNVSSGKNAHRATSKASHTLADLRGSLNDLCRCRDDDARSKLNDAKKKFQDETNSLFRRSSVDRPGPRTLLARVDMIEDVYQRAVPNSARIYANVAVTDGEYFSIARFSGRMSLLLMTVVLAFLTGSQLLKDRGEISPEVLAIVLTLFSAIQAGQMQSPDRSSLRGLLSGAGNWLIAASILPTVLLAVALAFFRSGWTPVIWAAACVGLQVLFQLAMLYGPLTASGTPRTEQRRKFSTMKPDYELFEALRSDYWRSTTAEALMMGRTAYARVVWQSGNPPPLRPLLEWENDSSSNGDPADVLALLRAGTYGQAVTFAVFREEPDKHWLETNAIVRKPSLDPDRLAPVEAITNIIDIFVGVSRDKMLTIAEHPISDVLKAAARKLIVLEAQLPVPAPVGDFPDRQWARIRIGLRDDGDIERLTPFLKGLHARIHTSVTSPPRCVVVLQAVPTTDPRITLGSERDPDAKLRQLLTSDLDLTPPMASGEGVDLPSWHVLAFCTEARSNIERDIVEQVAGAGPRVLLGGMAYALLHGMAVAIMVVHDAEKKIRSDEGVEHRTEFEVKLRSAESTELPILIDKQLTREQLGPVTDYPLLRVHFYWRDRPGALLNVLDSLSRILEEEQPEIDADQWSVSYARTQVAAGRAALARLTIRLHMPPSQLAMWKPNFEEIERKIRARARLEARAGRDANSPDGDLDTFEDPVISVSLMKTPIDARDHG
jgi:hypothetical protein